MAPLSATLESMGLVHLDHLESVSPKPPPTTPNCYKGLLGGTMFVRLDGVKRVGISCGRTGRSRRPDHVSGLYFEFWDGRPPANARYSGVRIEKSGAEPNAVEVHPGPHRDMHETCYAENRFERLETFAWFTTHDRDANDVKMKPTPLAKNCLSSASHIREEVCTNSDKLFWEIEDGKEGWTSVSQIAAFFKPKNKRLCGLEFTYKDSQVKRGGYTEGTKVILEVKSHEKVTGASSSVSATSVDGGVDIVSFVLGDNRRMMMDFSGVKVDDSDPDQVLPSQGHAVPVARKVPDGASKCVGVYLEMWPDVKRKVCVQNFGSVQIDYAPATLARNVQAGLAYGIAGLHADVSRDIVVWEEAIGAELFAISLPQILLPEVAMPLLLAPYNDSMRLGMGFNSYTQTLCIDGAVDATDETMITTETLQPKITSSSKLFERLSEVIDMMDISPAATMTTGRMEVHGHMNVFNDIKIDDADISLMVSVRVMSEITSLKGSARFLPIDGMEAGSPRFSETFGDSYISANFRSVKKGLTGSAMDLRNICKEVAITSINHGVEVTGVTDVASILRIAGEFPALVAQDPQRTWAILIKYKANRSFIEWSRHQILKPLDYDSVASYTSKLFDNYIQYNHLSRKVQDIISQRDKYSQVDKPRAIPLELNTLLAVKTLTRHPELLPEIDILNANLKDGLVQNIVNEVLSAFSRPIPEEESMVQEDPFLSSVAGRALSESSSGVEELHTPLTSDIDSCSISGRSLIFRDETEPSTDLATRMLVPPEVWVDLLPVKNDPPTSLVSQPAKTAPALNTPAPTVNYKELQILAAICGPYDVAAKLQDWVSPGENGDRLVIPLGDIKTLEENEGRRGLPPGTKTKLWFVYKYTDMPIRVFSLDYDAQSTETLEITHDGLEGAVFYTYSRLKGIQSAVSMGTAGSTLVDQQQLATRAEIGKEATDSFSEKESKEVNANQVALAKGIHASDYSCTFQCGTLKVSPSETAFLQFENGVKFFFRNNGRFEVLDKHDEVFWSSEEAPKGRPPRLLEFCGDGILRLWNTDGQAYWTPLMKNFTRRERKLVFSSEFPYLEIDSEGSCTFIELSILGWTTRGNDEQPSHHSVQIAEQEVNGEA
ncbi:hypothetical protein LB506_011859 [Fusarium annulatum]|nr:hypothetical protein LB506_011859 [Fusarium annulatum]